MNEQELKQHLRGIAQEAFPDRPDPWPAWWQVVKAKRRTMSSKGCTMKANEIHSAKRFSSKGRTTVLVCISLLFLGVLFVATPQGRVTARAWLRFFTLGQSDTAPWPTETPVAWIQQPRTAADPTRTPQPTLTGPDFEAQCGHYEAPTCTLEQIRQMVNFTVLSFAPIPEGYMLVGATGGPGMIEITYQSANRDTVLLLIESRVQLPAWEAGASAEIASVHMHGVVAEYVKGAYDGNRAQWDAQQDLQTLRWEQEGIWCTLLKMGSGAPMNKDQFVGLIGSLTTDVVPVVAQLQPTQMPTEDIVAMLREQNSLTVAQLEAEAGYAVHLPTQLPETLTLFGGRYEPTSQIASIFYWYNVPGLSGMTDGLILRQQPIPQNGACALCSPYIVGQYTSANDTNELIGANAETVTIGDVTGQYIEGVWVGKESGWSWEPDPYMKRMRWQKDSTAYELTFMGMGITQEDMMKIANSIP